MRVVVTGGAGFIGSNLVDALIERGDEVVVVDNFTTGKREYVNAKATLLEHDIREPYEADAEVVFHLAAQADVQTSMQRPEYDAAVNVVGTVNVLRATRGAQVIFASSGGAGYGECPVPAAEDAPLLPPPPYGIAKNVGEETSRARCSTGRGSGASSAGELRSRSTTACSEPGSGCRTRPRRNESRRPWTRRSTRTTH